MADTPMDDILNAVLGGMVEEEPPGPTEEVRRRREQRFWAIRQELLAQKEAERKAKLTPEQLLDEVEPLELFGKQLDLIRQWFDAVQDLNSAYLTPADYQLARDIYEQLGMRVPHSILEGCDGKR